MFSWSHYIFSTRLHSRFLSTPRLKFTSITPFAAAIMFFFMLCLVIRDEMWRWVKRKTTAVFGFDVRSVAVFRILLGLMVLWHLLEKAPYLYELLDDRGIFPRNLLVSNYPDHNYSVSIFHISGWWVISGALFVVHGIAAACLMSGYHTRTAAIVNWFMLVSFNHRIPIVDDAGESYLRICSFWAIFLPLDAIWSVDAKALVPHSRAMSVSPGSVSIVVQICLLYVISVYQKNGGDWGIYGAATFHAMKHGDLQTPLARAIVEGITNNNILRIATRVSGPLVLAVEFWTPWLFFSPLHTSACRIAGVAIFFAMHCSFALILGLYKMSCCFVPALVCMLPITEICNRLGAPLSDIRRNAKVTRKRRGKRDCSTITARQVATWGICMVLLPTIAVSALSDTDRFRETLPPSPEWMRLFLDSLGLHQAWKMFSPSPTRHTFRFAFEGALVNGSNALFHISKHIIDFEGEHPFRLIADDQEMSAIRIDGQSELGTPLWHFFFEIHRHQQKTHNSRSGCPGKSELKQMRRNIMIASVSRYMCREWNRRHPIGDPHQLAELKVWEIAEMSIFPYKERHHVYTEVVWHHHCTTPKRQDALGAHRLGRG